MLVAASYRAHHIQVLQENFLISGTFDSMMCKKCHIEHNVMHFRKYDDCTKSAGQSTKRTFDSVQKMPYRAQNTRLTI